VLGRRFGDQQLETVLMLGEKEKGMQSAASIEQRGQMCPADLESTNVGGELTVQEPLAVVSADLDENPAWEWRLNRLDGQAIRC
jgi:hypothetical protein